MQSVQTGQPEPATSSMAGQARFDAWLARARDRVEQALADHLHELQAAAGPHTRLPEAVQYCMMAGGKRLRPILVIETCRVCGGRIDAAVPPALAMEFVHTFSLVHDDLPAMDNDDLRRGKPTCHKVYGDALAILAGDWLATHAFALLSSDRVDRQAVPLLLRTLADGTERMIQGQGADIEGEGRPADGDVVRYIHLHKTAALIETCCRLGAICAGASEAVANALARYGRHLGLAFQITDDCLDATGTEAQLGKRVGKDAVVAKQTYPAVFGLAESHAQAQREIDTALQAIESFGGQADYLRELARFVIRRDR